MRCQHEGQSPERLIRACTHLVDAVAHINKIAARVDALERRPEVEYVGAYAAGRSYKPGNLITLRGGLWLCKTKTALRPGASGDWLLICKSGHAA